MHSPIPRYVYDPEKQLANGYCNLELVDLEAVGQEPLILPTEVRRIPYKLFRAHCMYTEWFIVGVLYGN
eukprot:COSAG05_NODE_886_length_6751_cov_151.638906_12_plen_69_part_00